MAKQYDVAAYVWPAYTGKEPRTRVFWPEGIGEWETVKKAGPKFDGHSWPRKPLWGYVNEADPSVMRMQIDAAADHGVNVFIYDWYWYDRRPFLEKCLNDGYLKAPNNDRVKFYLMWANHDVNHLWDTRLAHVIGDEVIWHAAVDRPEFERIASRLIEKYFKHPSYYTIADEPVFMIYDLPNLVRGLGGPDETREAFAWLQGRARDAGLPGIHLQLCMWNSGQNLSGVDSSDAPTQAETIERLDLRSMSHYQYVHFTDIDRTYPEIMKDVLAEWDRLDREYPVPYFPHVSVGWDNNPRFKTMRPGIVKENTPENVEKALREAKAFVDARPDRAPLITINSWNEWTETSYLQPDDIYGYGYLDAVRRVFMDE